MEKKARFLLVTHNIVASFFLRPHLFSLSRHFDLKLAYNPRIDEYLPALPDEISKFHIPLRRKPSFVADVFVLFVLLAKLIIWRPKVLFSVAPKAGFVSMIVGYCLRIKYRVHLFQGEVWATRTGAARWFLKECDRITLRLASHALAVSQGEKQFLESNFGALADKVEVLGKGTICGVPKKLMRGLISQDKKIALRSKLGLPVGQDVVICIFLGRLSVEKGVVELIEALKVLQPSSEKQHLVLVGPEELLKINDLIDTLPNAVQRCITYRGFVNDASDLLAASDFLCLPSHREGFGMVVLEAAGACLPSIGSRIYGLTDAIVDGKTGLLVEKGNVLDLADALGRLFHDEMLRSRLGESAFARVSEDFSQEVVVNRYTEYFRNLETKA